MIEVCVGQKYVKIHNAFIDKLVAQSSGPGTAVKHERSATAIYLETGRIAAIAGKFWIRAWHSAPDTPESHPESVLFGSGAALDPGCCQMSHLSDNNVVNSALDPRGRGAPKELC